MTIPKEIKKITDFVWELPATYKKGMKVPVKIVASETLLNSMDEGVFEQITNVACLPGIQKNAIALPDSHWGYGFPIGGVAAFDLEDGIISPGGIGFDINCGVRLVKTNLKYDEVKPQLKKLMDHLFKTVPAGVGRGGFVKLSNEQFDDIITKGTRWCVDNGYGVEDDLKKTENSGCIEGADTSKISAKARSRGIGQLGTVGSGNHFLELQIVNKIRDEELAKKFGLFEGQVTFMIHCGSRGFGHQVATDYLKIFNDAMGKYNIKINDKELACAPFNSVEGQNYFKAMACAANMAFANRQVIMHRAREGFEHVFGKKAEEMGIELVYDVAHNIAKVEEYLIDGVNKKVVVHRKGATRAFPPGHKELIPLYQETGQPIVLGGSMETESYLLVGTQKAMDETFGSTAHGVGRTMSRSQARKQVRGEKLQQDMAKKGIYVRTASMSGLAEEAGFAYKSVNAVVDSLHESGISKRVCSFKPIANLKG